MVVPHAVAPLAGVALERGALAAAAVAGEPDVGELLLRFLVVLRIEQRHLPAVRLLGAFHRREQHVGAREADHRVVCEAFGGGAAEADGAAEGRRDPGRTLLVADEQFGQHRLEGRGGGGVGAAEERRRHLLPRLGRHAERVADEGEDAVEGSEAVAERGLFGGGAAHHPAALGAQGAHHRRAVGEPAAAEHVTLVDHEAEPPHLQQRRPFLVPLPLARQPLHRREHQAVLRERRRIRQRRRPSRVDVHASTREGLATERLGAAVAAAAVDVKRDLRLPVVEQRARRDDEGAARARRRRPLPLRVLPPHVGEGALERRAGREMDPRAGGGAARALEGIEGVERAGQRRDQLPHARRRA